MSGISSQYTNFEKVEISSAICTTDNFDNWVITITLKNSGTAAATLDSLYVNDVAADLDSSEPGAAVDTISTDLNVTASSTTLESGVVDIITVWIGYNHLTLSSGTTVNVKIHSASGMDYIKLVKLI